MIRAFIQGIKEFRSNVTTRVEASNIEAYDWGREIAHIVTFRRFDG